MLADSEITVESWIDRGGREEYEEGADGSAGAYQVSQARPLGRLEFDSSPSGRQVLWGVRLKSRSVGKVVQAELYTAWDIRRSETSLANVLWLRSMIGRKGCTPATLDTIPTKQEEDGFTGVGWMTVPVI